MGHHRCDSSSFNSLSEKRSKHHKKNRKSYTTDDIKFNTKGIIKNGLSYLEMANIQPLPFIGASADPNIAVSDELIIATVTNSVAIYKKNTLELVSKFSMVGDSNVVGIWNISQFPILSQFPVIADTNIIWDVRSKRFWLIGQNVFLSSSIFIAVSKTSSPSSYQDFYPYVFNVNRNIDFPTIAVDDQAVYVGDIGYFLAFHITPFLTGQPLVLLMNQTVNDYFGEGYLYALQPTPDKCGHIRRVILIQTTIDAITQQYYASNFFNIYWVENILTTPALFTSVLNVPEYRGVGAATYQQRHPVENQYNIPIVPLFAFNYTIMARPDYRGSKIYVAHSIFNKTSNGVIARWYEADISSLSNPILIQSGNVNLNTDNVLYVGVSVDHSDNIGMVLTYAGPYNYHTTAYTGRLKNDPLGTMRMPLQYFTGGDIYLQEPPSEYVNPPINFLSYQNRVGESLRITTDPQRKNFFFSTFDPESVPIVMPNPTIRTRFFVEISTNIPGYGPYTSIATQYSPLLAGPLTAPGIISSPLNGCSGVGAASGKIVLLQRGNCTFSSKTTNVTAAGGLATIIYNNSASPPFIGGGSTVPGAGPTIMISLADGLSLTNAINKGAILTLKTYNISNPFGSNIGSTFGIFEIKKCKGSTVNAPQTQNILSNDIQLSAISERETHNEIMKYKIFESNIFLEE